MGFQEPDAIGLVINILQPNSHPFGPRRWEIFANEVGTDR